MHVGCSALSHETAAAWGNEQRVLGAAARTNVADPGDIAGTLMPAITEGMSPAERSRVERYAASPQGQEFGRRFDTGSCEVASATARRVGLGAGVERALKEAVEWWNGQGPPDGLQGEEIALPGRIARAAADAARFDDLGGTEAVVAALRRARVASSTPRSSRRSPRTRMSCSPRPAPGIRASGCSRSSPSRSARSTRPS